MIIHADRSVCIGAGMCVLAAPELFAQDDADGIVDVLVEVPDTALHDAARKAVDTCPSGALSLSRADQVR